MDLNLAFDDEDLKSTRKNSSLEQHNNVAYNVKLCTPEWFERAAQADSSPCDAQDKETDQKHQIFKFSADLHYHKKNFLKAVEEYERVLEFLPENNSTVRQDAKESLCRCYARCGLTEKSLNLARELVLEFATEDEAKQRQSLILLYSVCERGGRWAECVDALEKYIALQPFFAPSWEKLGDALIKTMDGDGTGAVDCEDDVAHRMVWLKALTCYVRARHLCESTLGTASHLVEKRDKNFIAEITKKIDLVPLSKEEMEFACSCSEDLSKDLDKGHGTAKDIDSQKTFFQRLYSWFEDFLRKRPK